MIAVKSRVKRYYFDRFWKGEVGVWVVPNSAEDPPLVSGFVVEMHCPPVPSYKAYLVIPVV